MRVFRYMSEPELKKLLTGKTIYNHSAHEGQKTNSVGFCFFNVDDIEPTKAYFCLLGIASVDYLVIFNLDEEGEKLLTKSQGTYREPEVGNMVDKIDLTEYCTQRYSTEHFQIYQIWQSLIPMPVVKF